MNFQLQSDLARAILRRIRAEQEKTELEGNCSNCEVKLTSTDIAVGECTSCGEPITSFDFAVVNERR